MIPDSKQIEAISKFDVIEMIIIGLIILAGLVLVKVLPRIIDSRIQKLQTDNHQLETETNTLVKNIGETISRFETNQIELTQKVNEMVKADKKNQMRTKDILKVIIYNDKLPILDRQEALLDYFALGGNGPTRNYALKEIILPYKELWNSVEQRAREESPDYDPKKIFDTTLAEIRKVTSPLG